MNESKVFRWDPTEQPPLDEIGAVVADLSGDRPMVSVDETELRAPMRPASADPDFGLGIPGFAVTWNAKEGGR